MPRPAVDPAFADALLERVLQTDPAWLPAHLGGTRRRIYYVGGALAGAAIALGAAFGWRRVRSIRDLVGPRAA